MSEFQNKDPTEQTHTEVTKPYTDLRFSIGVQTQTSEGQKMLHITSSLSSTSEYETIPISHITEEVVTYGNGLDLALKQYFQTELGNTPNNYFVQSTDFEINTDLENYPHVNLVCKICWADIEEDLSHENIKHPACFCSTDTRYSSPRFLDEHFKTHQTPIPITCPDSECGVELHTLYDVSVHHLSHPYAEERGKVLCNTKTMDMPECFKELMNPYKTVHHILMFHIKTFANFNNFFNQFTLLINGRNNQDTTHSVTQNRTNHDANATMGGFSGAFSSVSPNIGGRGNGSRDDENDEQDPWTPFLAPNGGQDDVYVCENEVCLELDLTFRSLSDLNNHVKRFHRCIYEDCNFSNMNNQILREHMKTHEEAASFKCNICNKVFNRQSTLDYHIANSHSLSCAICKSHDFSNRQALHDHSKLCTQAELVEEEEDNLTEWGSQKTPMSLLIKALWDSKANIPPKLLKEVKSLEIKQNMMKRAPELYTKKMDTLIDPINFDTANPGKFVSVPGNRLAKLPKFEPVEGNPISNYIQVETLITETVSYTHLTLPTICSV